MSLRGVEVCPCRTIANTRIAVLPEWFGSLSNLYSLCVCRHSFVDVVSARRRGTAPGGMRCGTRRMGVCDIEVPACRTIEDTSIAALPESFGSLSLLNTGCGFRVQQGVWLDGPARAECVGLQESKAE
jgi:hypothetical protein